MQLYYIYSNLFTFLLHIGRYSFFTVTNSSIHSLNEKLPTKGEERVEQRIRVLLTRNRCHPSVSLARIRAEGLGRTSSFTDYRRESGWRQFLEDIDDIRVGKAQKSRPSWFPGLALLLHSGKRLHIFPELLKRVFELLAESRNAARQGDRTDPTLPALPGSIFFRFIVATELLTLACINRWSATNVSSFARRPLDRSVHAHDRLMLLGDVTLRMTCFIGYYRLNCYLNMQIR